MANAVNYVVLHEDGSLTRVGPLGHTVTYTATLVRAAYDTFDDWEQRDIDDPHFVWLGVRDWLTPRCGVLTWAISVLQRWGRGAIVRRRLRPYRPRQQRPLRRFERDPMDSP